MAITIKGFKIEEKIGEGNTGIVYSATQLNLGRKVAIKVLKTKVAESEENIQKFIAEARTAAMLNHPNIVTGIDVGASGGKYYFVMELLPGGTLEDLLIKKGKISEKEAVKWLRDCALALNHAYKSQIIHCDIKPANIMFDCNSILKLTDLGIARIADNDGTTPTKIIGTAHYLAPEQLTKKEPLDTRTDIYSLGTTFYHILSGNTPFSGKSSKEIALARLKTEAIKLHDIDSGISEKISNLISEMMATDKSVRPENPEALLSRIDELRKGKEQNTAPASGRSNIHVIKVQPKTEKSNKLTIMLTILVALTIIASLAILSYYF